MITHLRRAIASFILLTFLVAGHGVAQTPFPIALQVEIFNDAAATVLSRPENRAVATEVRILAIGSWTNPKTMATAKDIDLTLGHRSKNVEERLVKEINAVINNDPRTLGRPPHVIKLIHDKDTRFVDFIRGDTGQMFVYHHAKKSAPEGLATMRFERRPDGTLVKAPDVSAEAFWHETGKTLPIQITQPQRFLDDAYVLAKNADTAYLAERLAKGLKPDPVERAVLYAKYLNNIDSFLLPTMAVQYNKDIPLDVLKIDEALRDQMKALMDLKKSGLQGEELRKAAAKLLKIDPLKIDEVTSGFMKNVEKYLEESHVTAGYLDGLQRKLLNDAKYGPVKAIADLPSGVLNRTLTKARELSEIIGKHLGPGALDVAGRIADVAALAYQFASEGMVKWDDVANAILGWGVPQLVLPAMAADIGRQLFVGAFTMGFNALFFDPLINAPLLQKIFDPKDASWVYGERPWVNEPEKANPFSEIFKFNRKPLKPETLPETLYCASLSPTGDERYSADTFRTRLTPAAEEYVRLLKTSNLEPSLQEFRGLDGQISGAAAFRPQLIVDRLVADWSKGQRMRRKLIQMESQESTPVYEPPQVPFLVMVDGVRIAAESELRRTPFPKTTKPGQPIEFKVTLQRQFGTVRYLLEPVELVAKWCELGGMEPLEKWLAASQDDPKVYGYFYDTGKPEPGKPESIQAEVDVRNFTAWNIDGWPLDLGAPFGGRLKADGPIKIVLPDGETRVTKESSPSRAADYRLHLTPGIDAGPISIDLTFRFTETFGIEPPKEPVTTTYRMTLTGSVEAAPTLTNAAELPPPATRIPPPPDPPSRPLDPPATMAAPCEAKYQAVAAEARARTLWNIAGYSNVSNGCPAAESVLDGCYKAAKVRRDSGIHNADTDACRDSFISACRGENLAAATAERDRCLARATTENEVQKARDQAALAQQKAREGQRARELAKQAQAQTEQLARQQEADRLRKIEEEKRAAERRAREQAQQAESQQARRWEELQRQGAAQAALDRQREIDAQRRKAEEADARRRADAERRQREERDRAEIDAGNRPPASVPAPAPPTPPVPSPQTPTPVSRPPAGGWPSDFSLEVTAEPRGAAGSGRVRTEVIEVQQNRLIRYNNQTTSEGTFSDGLLKGRWLNDGSTFEYRLNRDGTVVWILNWNEPSNGQPRGVTRDGTWTMKPLGGPASPSASQPPQVPSPPGQTPPRPTTPPAQTPPVQTPPATPPPAQQQPPCPPAPLPGLANQQTNLRCFGIPGPGQ